MTNIEQTLDPTNQETLSCWKDPTSPRYVPRRNSTINVLDLSRSYRKSAQQRINSNSLAHGKPYGPYSMKSSSPPTHRRSSKPNNTPLLLPRFLSDNNLRTNYK